MSREYDNIEYRAYEGFKTDKNISKNRLRLNYHGGSCDILQYSMIYKISYDPNLGNIYLIYSDGLYQITGENLSGLVDSLQAETVHSIFCKDEGQSAPEGKPVVNMIEYLSGDAMTSEGED